MTQAGNEQSVEDCVEEERTHRFECLLNDEEQSDLLFIKKRKRWTKSQVVREGIRVQAVQLRTNQHGLTPDG